MAQTVEHLAHADQVKDGQEILLSVQGVVAGSENYGIRQRIELRQEDDLPAVILYLPKAHPVGIVQDVLPPEPPKGSVVQSKAHPNWLFRRDPKSGLWFKVGAFSPGRTWQALARGWPDGLVVLMPASECECGSDLPPF